MIPKRFWDKVDVRGVDECWNWLASTGGRRKCWYGRVTIKGKAISAHRHVMRTIHGDEAIEGKSVMHQCDNTLCVNPRHLKIGTHQENMDDKTLRSGKAGRWTFRKVVRARFFDNNIDKMIIKAQELQLKGCSSSDISIITGLDESLFI